VQQLADFPPDADAVSLLLRLALQAGTPCRDVPEAEQAPDVWVLADDIALLAAQEQALIARASGTPDWQAPSAALAGLSARRLAPRGLARGPLLGAMIAGVLLLSGIAAAGWGAAAAGLGLAALGVLAAALAKALAGLARYLLGEGPGVRVLPGVPGCVVDALAAGATFLALSPWPSLEPLAALGPVVIGLARLTGREQGALARPLAALADRAVLLGVMALAATLGLLPQVTALLAAVLLAGLLLRDARN
jgi:hypothetical protein